MDLRQHFLPQSEQAADATPKPRQKIQSNVRAYRPGGAAFQRHNAQGKEKGASFFDQERWESALAKHLSESPRVMATLYEVYLNIRGYWDLPFASIEGQSDGARSGGLEQSMTRLCYKATAVIQAYDESHREALWGRAFHLDGGTVPPQHEIVLNRGGGPCTSQRKFLIPHDHTFTERARQALSDKGLWPEERRHSDPHGYQRALDTKKRALRKEEAVRVLWMLVEGYTHMGPLKQFLADMRAAGKGDHIHDMADAFLIALQLAMVQYADYAQQVLGKRRPHEQRPDCPCLTLEQCHGGGTICGMGLDPGSSNMGFCVLELVCMQQVPEARRATSLLESPVWNRGDPEPCFRILLLELIDLEHAPWSDTQGHALFSYRPDVLRGDNVMRPDYMTDYHTIENFFYPSKGERRPAAKRKRQKVEVEEAKALPEGDGDVVLSPPAKRRRRLKRLDGAALEIAREDEHAALPSWAEVGVGVHDDTEDMHRGQVIRIDLTHE